MDHQSFRFYIPGIVFLIPIYLITCWITVNYYTDSDFRVFVLVGGITTFPVISLPVGWWIYNAYRVWWLIFTKGGYENKDFVKLIRKDTKPFYSPLTKSILIDFSHIKHIESWINFELDIFRKTFYPFTSKNNFQKEIEKKGVHPKFTEPLSDLILFTDKGYDYARSISSVRYGLESSTFALALSVPYAIGIRYIWLHHLNVISITTGYILWIVLLSVISILFILTLIVRWRIADKEYDARLNLTTLTSVSSNYFNLDFFKNKIPVEIVDKIAQLNSVSKKYAAFDLDNTLLINDIGEAVFALMVKKGIIKTFGWDDYLKLLETNRKAAYMKVIEVMNGLDLATLKNITYEILTSENIDIEIAGVKIPYPKPNQTMQSIISILKASGIEVYVVTASNSVSAEIACWEYFGIPSSNVFGAKLEINGRGKISFKSDDIPYADGKVSILKKYLQGNPIVTGGDGVWDKFLLDYTQIDGIRFWLGTDEEQYRKLKKDHYKDLQFYHIIRS